MKQHQTEKQIWKEAKEKANETPVELSRNTLQLKEEVKETISCICCYCNGTEELNEILEARGEKLSHGMCPPCFEEEMEKLEEMKENYMPGIA